MEELEIIINIADEVIPQWRNSTRSAENSFCRYLVVKEAYKSDVPNEMLVEKLGISRVMIIHYRNRYYYDNKYKHLDEKFKTEVNRRGLLD